ncbi:hypothetical protein [Pseudomonas rhodesiae]|uniref:hypothetical protein n=1 Tax=Pseudomonas rhodesiae TaxID=76760 RepID=UPI0020A15ED7|nr:hypothetical protein [Pseudomonas rhodesiae]MCP1510964.1 hypothetical protein [Pseudomonas rhodesiae]MDF9769782.1 hypothetical protein [Pseudomonas rhodesiae]
MSLQQAKRLAEIREEIELASQKLNAVHTGFRKKINEEVVAGFSNYLGSNGFEVTKSAYGASATYKDLKVNLTLAKPEDVYMGAYHSFDISVQSKKYDVFIVAILTGGPERRAVRPADPVQILEQDLENLNASLNIQLHSYKFDCAQRGGNNRVQPIMKDTIEQVIDEFVK